MHMIYRIAVASTDGKVVNQHFGRADTFYIIEADNDAMTVQCNEIRNVKPVCEGGEHNDEALIVGADRLSDCQYVLVSRVGWRAQDVLEQRQIHVFELPGVIEDSIKKLFYYIELNCYITSELQ